MKATLRDTELGSVILLHAGPQLGAPDGDMQGALGADLASGGLNHYLNRKM
jgi:hypothetical protein